MNTDLPEKCTKKALKEAVDQIVAEFDEQFRTGTIQKRKPAVAPVTAVNEPYAVMNDTPEAKMKMGDFVTEWLTAMRPNLARTTYQTYKSANRRFVEYLDIHYPGITLGELRHNHVQEFLNHKLDEGCKGSAVKQYYLAIHSGLAYAVKMEYLMIHPIANIKIIIYNIEKWTARKRERKKSGFGRKSGRKKSDFDNIFIYRKVLINPIDTAFERIKNGFVHTMSLT